MFFYKIYNDFLPYDEAMLLYNDFPLDIENNDKWYAYKNPLEMNKYAYKNFEDIGSVKRFYETLKTDSMLNYFKQESGFPSIENDPYLHGAGIHAYSTGGHLDLHLDYNIHPISKKERKLNFIYYLNKDWKSEWNGNLDLYNGENCVASIEPIFNRAVLFETNDDSIHGVPQTIKCPKDEIRKSLTLFYVQDSKPLNEYKEIRLKAKFLSNDPEKQRLSKIRSTRLITKNDFYKENHSE